ncbi:MAG: 5-formyltetrahydrofolate cyclo-ligase [Gammaproteobacteria bacterium]
MNKKKLRSELKNALKKLTVHEHALLSEKILAQLKQSSIFQKSKNIAAYWPFRMEVDWRPLLIESLPFLDKKFWFLPRIKPNNSNAIQMEFFEFIPQKTLLIPNAYGILEPDLHANRISPKDLDLMLLPCLGFDQKGYRLGYGAGFYDSFLKAESNHKIYKLILGFELQRLESIMPDPWDIPADAVLTEMGYF